MYVMIGLYVFKTEHISDLRLNNSTIIVTLLPELEIVYIPFDDNETAKKMFEHVTKQMTQTHEEALGEYDNKKE